MPVFTANIPGILKVGDRIEVGGKIKENARKMSINLCAQEGEEPRDVVLHFDVRFHRDNIISLSRKNGIWIGSGNYDTNYNMFVPGTIFRIVFEIKDTDVITIYCQGKFHSNFLPKIPLSMARFLVAWADVERITHCYFKVGPRNTSGDEGTPNGHLSQSPHRSPNAMMTAGDARRRSRKKTTPGQPTTCSESSEEEVKSRKGEGRADKFFYDTLMCQPPEHPKFAQTDTARFRRDQSLRRHEYERRLKETTDTEKNESEEYSEDLASRNESSMVESEDGNQGIKKRSRRVGKFGSLAQVVNFMGKTRRN